MKVSKKGLIALGIVALFFVTLVACAPGVNPIAADVWDKPSGPPPLDPDDPNPPDPPVQTAWIDRSCTTCHATETATVTDAKLMAKVHYDEAPGSKMGEKCAYCHTQTTILANLHADIMAPSTTVLRNLKHTVINEASCLASGCHVKSELAARTVNSRELVDLDGTVVNPHDVPTNVADHAGMNCLSCHTSHRVQSAISFCQTCHHEHEMTFTCFICH